MLILSKLANCQSISTSSLFAVFGGEADDVGYSIKQTLDSGYIVTGQTTSFGSTSTDIYIAKTNKYLIPKWQKNFGGFFSEVGKSIIELSDSSIVIAGFSNSFGNGGYDALIIKTDKNGNTLWQKTWGGLDWDFANSICKSSDGNLIVCGNTYSFERGNSDAFVIKLDLNGNLIWQKIYGGSNFDELKCIIPTSEGGFIAAGTTMSYGEINGDIWITKLNSTGDSTWFVTNGGNKHDKGNGIVQDKFGDYLICGGTRSFPSSNGNDMDAYVCKLSNSSSFIWKSTAGNSRDEEAFSIKNSVSNYGNIVITYGTNEFITFGTDIKTLLLDFNGYYVRGGSFGSTKDELGYDLQNTYDKGYVTVGYSESFNARLKDIFIVKYDSEMTIGPQMVNIKQQRTLDHSISFYPTLVNNNCFFIESEIPLNQNKINFNIFDLNGIEIRKYSLEIESENKLKIRFNDVSSGIYFLKLNQFVFKFIIQK